MRETLSDRELNDLERRILEAEKGNRDVKLDRRDAWAIYEALKAAAEMPSLKRLNDQLASELREAKVEISELEEQL